MGPEAGKNGGYVFTEGTIEQIKNDKKSMIGPFLTNHYDEKMRPISPIEQLFEFGKIHLSTNQIHTVHPLEVDIPKGKLQGCYRSVRFWKNNDDSRKLVTSDSN